MFNTYNDQSVSHEVAFCKHMVLASMLETLIWLLHWAILGNNPPKYSSFYYLNIFSNTNSWSLSLLDRIQIRIKYFLRLNETKTWTRKITEKNGCTCSHSRLVLWWMIAGDDYDHNDHHNDSEDNGNENATIMKSPTSVYKETPHHRFG